MGPGNDARICLINLPEVLLISPDCVYSGGISLCSPFNYMRKFCLACDLKDDDGLINAYDTYHKEVWPEIKDSLKQSGIRVMEIYRTGNRLFMIIRVTDDFSFEKKASMDLANSVVQKWESIMAGFQQQIAWSPDDVKWVLMERIFHFEASDK
jgi:L-rhamnose mutarotase